MEISQKRKTELLHKPTIPLLGIYLKKKKKEKHYFEKLHVPQYSRQHYLQLPVYGNNVSVLQQMNR